MAVRERSLARSRALPFDLDTRVALAAVAAYFVAAMVLLPATSWPHAIGAGAAVFTSIWLVAAWLGRGRFHLLSVWIVWAASLAALAMPTFPAMGDRVRWSTTVGFVGVFAAELLWVARRWEPRRLRGRRLSLLAAWGYGAVGALGLSALAAIPIALMLLRGGREAGPMLWVFPAYFGGMLAAATCYWLLQPIRNLGTGRFLIGVLGGTCAYGAMGPVLSIVEQKPIGLGVMLGIGLLAGSCVGPSVALTIDED